ncbi:hypothetical protein N7452_001581 [Penicillium brevicompactum]|uniref:Phytanoyl-CoA dioxygenase family protein n=1 Tax=Penicillium brevicompactum TaxID=5074 RepID=A0A9W9R2L8_PENBR|nr:hypothetical protein N7452_001581 [Penicillium brevicompactum]
MGAQTRPNAPTIIRLSDDELASKEVESHNLQRALEALNEDGLVVIQNAINPAHLDKMNERMLSDAQKLSLRKGTHVNFNPGSNNIQQEPPTDKGYLFEDVLANPWAAHILECALGRDPKLRFYSANTAFKAEARQPVHVDVFDYPQAPHGYCVNVNLVDVSPKNGSTEFWLGTHNDTALSFVAVNGTGDDGPDPNIALQKRSARAKALGITIDDVQTLIEERRLARPPIQATLPKGSLIIRDIRIWHAGMPNQTEEPRVMLVSIVFSGWYRSNQKIYLPEQWKDNFNWGRLAPCVEWTGNDFEYLQGAHEFNLIQLP